jgi:hypothetical protein
VYEFPAEAPFDAQVAPRDIRIQRRSDLDDPVVLDVQSQRATHSTVRTNGIGLRLFRFVPGSGATHFKFTHEHERAGRTDPYAVSAIDARRIWQWHGVLRRDARIESPARDGDGKSILSIGSAGFHTLVTENALAIVTHVKPVVDFRRLLDGGRRGAIGWIMETWTSRVPSHGWRRGGWWTKPFGSSPVKFHVEL